MLCSCELFKRVIKRNSFLVVNFTLLVTISRFLSPLYRSLFFKYLYKFRFHVNDTIYKIQRMDAQVNMGGHTWAAASFHHFIWSVLLLLPYCCLYTILNYMFCACSPSPNAFIHSTIVIENITQITCGYYYLIWCNISTFYFICTFVDVFCVRLNYLTFKNFILLVTVLYTYEHTICVLCKM